MGLDTAVQAVVGAGAGVHALRLSADAGGLVAAGIDEEDLRHQRVGRLRGVGGLGPRRHGGFCEGDGGLTRRCVGSQGARRGDDQNTRRHRAKQCTDRHGYLLSGKGSKVPRAARAPGVSERDRQRVFMPVNVRLHSGRIHCPKVSGVTRCFPHALPRR
jgi:hypothetical protein